MLPAVPSGPARQVVQEAMQAVLESLGNSSQQVVKTTSGQVTIDPLQGSGLETWRPVSSRVEVFLPEDLLAELEGNKPLAIVL